MEATQAQDPVPVIQPDRLYTYQEAADLLGVNKYLVKNSVLDGRMPSIRLSSARGIRRVRGRDLLAWLDRGGVA
jgi:excisionase family DNA binding protein